MINKILSGPLTAITHSEKNFFGYRKQLSPNEKKGFIKSKSERNKTFTFS